MNVVIIGGGSAGTTCAFELRKLNKDVDITILESSPHVEYSPCALPYVISGEIPSFDKIFIFDKEIYKQNNINLLLQTTVTAINQDLTEIIYEREGLKKTILYDYLVIATGSKPFVPQIKGLENTSYNILKTIDDAKKISEKLQPNNSSVVIGGGLIGVELAISLQQKGESVTLIEARDCLLSSMLDTDMAKKLRFYLEGRGIVVYEKTTIQNINTNSLDLSSMQISFDKLFLATGTIANTFLAKQIGLKIDKGIIVDEHLQTSDEKIFACGDCVESKEYISNQQILSQLGTTAVRQAKIVAQKILGADNIFSPVMNTTITKVGKLFVASVGLTTNKAKEQKINVISGSYTGTVRSSYYDSKTTISIKLLSNEEGMLIGGQIIGQEEVVGRINLLALAMQKKCSLKDLASLEMCYNPASSPIFDPMAIAAEICIKKTQFLSDKK